MGNILRYVLVGKVDRRFNQSDGPQQISSPPINPTRHFAVQNTHGMTSLPIRLRVNDIRKTLNLGQIQPSVHKGAAREFSGFRHAKRWRPLQFHQNRAYDGDAPMKMQLDDIFAREARTPFKKQNKRLIQNIAL